MSFVTIYLVCMFISMVTISFLIYKLHTIDYALCTLRLKNESHIQLNVKKPISVTVFAACDTYTARWMLLLAACDTYTARWMLLLAACDTYTARWMLLLAACDVIGMHDRYKKCPSPSLLCRVSKTLR